VISSGRDNRPARTARHTFQISAPRRSAPVGGSSGFSAAFATTLQYVLHMRTFGWEGGEQEPAKPEDCIHTLLLVLHWHHLPPVTGGCDGRPVVCIPHTSRRPRFSSRSRCDVIGGAHEPTDKCARAGWLADGAGTK